jgi:hypothetical protein
MRSDGPIERADGQGTTSVGLSKLRGGTLEGMTPFPQRSCERTRTRSARGRDALGATGNGRTPKR